MEWLGDVVALDEDRRLYLSAAIGDWQPILERGITTVIDLEGDVDADVPQHVDQFLYVYLPINDGQMPNLLRLHATAKMAAGLVTAGEKVLCHCGLGLNRSALMAGLILMYNGTSGPDAVARIQKRRPGAFYNAVFRDYLLGGPTL